MVLRWLSALVGIPFFLVMCFWGARPFCTAITVVAAIGLAEMVKAYRGQGIRPNLPIAVLGLLPALIGLLDSPWVLFRDLLFLKRVCMVTGAVLLVAFVWEVVRGGQTGEMRAGQRVGYGLLIGIYIAFFGGIIWLRHWSGPVGHGLLGRFEPGALLITLVTFVCWATDAFALFVGRATGKHKLSPKLSPAKTLEGAFGGFVAAVLAGALFGWLFFGSIVGGLAIGAITGILAQVGDLFESALKREAGIKDFGNVMPGHGGALDRFDSLLFVAPVVAVLLAWTGDFILR